MIPDQPRKTFTFEELDRLRGVHVRGKLERPVMLNGVCFIGFAQLPSGTQYLIDQMGTWKKFKGV